MRSDERPFTLAGIRDQRNQLLGAAQDCLQPGSSGNRVHIFRNRPSDIAPDFGFESILAAVRARRPGERAAYIVDVLAQASGFRERWLKLRWAIYLLGIAFAGVLTRFWALGLFSTL